MLGELKSAGANVTAVVGENAANIQCSFRVMTEEDGSVLFGGCTAHLFNLLVGDFCTSVPTVKAIFWLSIL